MTAIPVHWLERAAHWQERPAGSHPLPGANAPNARTPQVNQAEVNRSTANETGRVLSEKDIIQGPFDIEEPTDQHQRLPRCKSRTS